jgi:hypothetical protein
LKIKSIDGQATTAAMNFSRWQPGEARMPHCNANKRKIKIVSIESSPKKFLLNWFCRHPVARHHFSATMDVLASNRLTHLATDHQKLVSRTFNK